MNMGERLEQAILRSGMTVNAVAKTAGVSAQTLYSIIKRNNKKIDVDILLKVIRVLDTSFEFLVEDEVTELDEYYNLGAVSLTPAGHRVGRAYEKATPPVQRTVEVALDPFMEEDDPLDNIIKVDFSKSERRASAGTGIYLDDESMITVKARLEALPSDYQRYPDRYFGVPVGGDSMEPTYYDGDLLIVCKEPVNVGEIGIFTMDGEGYVKELGRGVLHSLNPDYDDIPLVEDVRCNGKVVGTLDPEDIFEE